MLAPVRQATPVLAPTLGYLSGFRKPLLHGHGRTSGPAANFIDHDSYRILGTTLQAKPYRKFQLIHPR
jgi:hypothetical protein